MDFLKEGKRAAPCFRHLKHHSPKRFVIDCTRPCVYRPVSRHGSNSKYGEASGRDATFTVTGVIKVRRYVTCVWNWSCRFGSTHQQLRSCHFGCPWALSNTQEQLHTTWVHRLENAPDLVIAGFQLYNTRLNQHASLILLYPKAGGRPEWASTSVRCSPEGRYAQGFRYDLTPVRR